VLPASAPVEIVLLTMSGESGRCAYVCFKVYVSTVLLLNGLAMLGFGTLCSFLPDEVLAFVTEYQDTNVTYIATAVLSVAGALMLSQVVLVAAAFVVWIQASYDVAVAVTVAVLIFAVVQWLGCLFLSVGYHDYEQFPSWVLVAQIVGSAGFGLLNALAIMWVFFFHRGQQDQKKPLAHARLKRSKPSKTPPRSKTKGRSSRADGNVTELEDPLLDNDSLDEENPTEPDDSDASSAPSGKLDDEPEKKYGFGRLFSLVKPHICWLIAGCAALLVRLPFSLAQVCGDLFVHHRYTNNRSPHDVASMSFLNI